MKSISKPVLLVVIASLPLVSAFVVPATQRDNLGEAINHSSSRQDTFQLRVWGGKNSNNQSRFNPSPIPQKSKSPLDTIFQPFNEAGDKISNAFSTLLCGGPSQAQMPTPGIPDRAMRRGPKKSYARKVKTTAAGGPKIRPPAQPAAVYNSYVQPTPTPMTTGASYYPAPAPPQAAINSPSSYFQPPTIASTTTTNTMNSASYFQSAAPVSSPSLFDNLFNKNKNKKMPKKFKMSPRQNRNSNNRNSNNRNNDGMYDRSTPGFFQSNFPPAPGPSKPMSYFPPVYPATSPTPMRNTNNGVRMNSPAAAAATPAGYAFNNNNNNNGVSRPQAAAMNGNGNGVSPKFPNSNGVSPQFPTYGTNTNGVNPQFPTYANNNANMNVNNGGVSPPFPTQAQAPTRPVAGYPTPSYGMNGVNSPYGSPAGMYGQPSPNNQPTKKTFLKKYKSIQNAPAYNGPPASYQNSSNSYSNQSRQPPTTYTRQQNNNYGSAYGAGRAPSPSPRGNHLSSEAGPPSSIAPIPYGGDNQYQSNTSYRNKINSATSNSYTARPSSATTNSPRTSTYVPGNYASADYSVNNNNNGQGPNRRPSSGNLLPKEAGMPNSIAPVPIGGNDEPRPQMNTNGSYQPPSYIGVVGSKSTSYASDNYGGYANSVNSPAPSPSYPRKNQLPKESGMSNSMGPNPAQSDYDRPNTQGNYRPIDPQRPYMKKAKLATRRQSYNPYESGQSYNTNNGQQVQQQQRKPVTWSL